MSVTVSTCQQICNCPSNTSKAKMLFTFSKASRFSKRKTILCDKFYTPQQLTPTRTTSFGLGNKYDFTKESSLSPSPNTYNIRNSFEAKPNKGFGFGKGRQEMEVTGPLILSKSNRNPGPGTYALSSTLSNSSFTITGKFQQQDKEKKLFPGPGSYQSMAGISPSGRYYLSKFRNSCARNFGTREPRCQTSYNNQKPGPGMYETKCIDLSPQGKYASSKLKNCTSMKFSTGHRSALSSLNQTPAPGSYKLPSEFGHYQSKSFVQAQKQNTKTNN